LHLVFLLESTPCIRKPGGHLSQRHFCDDRQHDLLAFRRIRVLDVFVQPSLQRARRLARRVLAAHVQTSVTAIILRRYTVRYVSVNQLGQLSFPSLRGRKMSSNPCIYMDYGGGNH